MLSLAHMIASACVCFAALSLPVSIHHSSGTAGYTAASQPQAPCISTFTYYLSLLAARWCATLSALPQAGSDDSDWAADSSDEDSSSSEGDSSGDDADSADESGDEAPAARQRAPPRDRGAIREWEGRAFAEAERMIGQAQQQWAKNAGNVPESILHKVWTRCCSDRQ